MAGSPLALQRSDDRTPCRVGRSDHWVTGARAARLAAWADLRVQGPAPGCVRRDAHPPDRNRALERTPPPSAQVCTARRGAADAGPGAAWTRETVRPATAQRTDRSAGQVPRP